MSNKNLKLSPSNSQAVADIYSNLINGFTQFRKVKTRSINEADATGAIYRKLCKATEDERHEIVTEFIINKIYPILETRDLDWSQDFFFIQTVFKNHLISMYRHANTNEIPFSALTSSELLEIENMPAPVALDGEEIYDLSIDIISEKITRWTEENLPQYLDLVPYIIRGVSSKQISQELNRSERTIRWQISKIIDECRTAYENDLL